MAEDTNTWSFLTLSFFFLYVMLTTEGRLTDICTTDSNCTNSVLNSFCNGQTCECRPGFFARSKTRCQRFLIGSACTNSTDCRAVIKNSLCQDGRCKCETGHKPRNRNNRVCEPRKIGDQCGSLEDCATVMNHTDCVNETCQCVGGYLKEGVDSCRPRRLGERCAQNFDCELGVNNSKCKKGVCECQLGYRSLSKNENSKCVFMKLGDSCKKNQKNQCKSAIPGSKCTGGKCVCKPGLVPNSDSTKCKAVGLGDECVDDTDCKTVPDSECVKKTCTCKAGFKDVKSSCEANLIGDMCSKDEDCPILDSFCDDDSKLCSCLEGLIATDELKQCSQIRLGEIECMDDSECLQIFEHSECSDSGLCECADGYMEDEIGSNCTVRFKSIGEPCFSDEDCNVFDTNFHCSESRKCACQPGYSLPFNRSNGFNWGKKVVCEKRKIAQHVCESNEDCLASVSNSNCGSCGSTPPGSLCRQKCPTSNTGNSTQLESCEIKTCLCNDGYKSVDDGTECRGRELGEKCERDEDCSGSVPNSVCLEGREMCYCKSGFDVVSRTQCKLRTIGGRCSKNSDCEDAITNSFCDLDAGVPGQGKCACLSGYRVANATSECRKRQIGDDTCTSDTDCSDAINGSRCDKGMCVCHHGYIPTPDLYNCKKQSLTDYCFTNISCSKAIPNSVCHEKKCQCASGFYGKNDSYCIVRKIGDANCRIDRDCQDAVNNSECVRGQCLCISGFQVSDDNKACDRRRINETSCEKHKDCSDAVPNSSCRQKLCVCDSGFYPAEDRRKCLKRKIGDLCVLDTDCFDVMDYSLCQDGLCACGESFDAHDNNSICVRRPSQIGAQCHFTEQCQKINAESTCNLTHGSVSTCVCPDHTFVDADRKSCVSMPNTIGDSCSRISQCSLKISHSTCDVSSSTCQCVNGYFPGTNRTVCHPAPTKLSDHCLEHHHCNGSIYMSECEQTNNTCVCVYGYKQQTDITCIERERIPKYRPFPPTIQETCENKCNKWNNSLCVDGQCQCDYRYARRYKDTNCVPVQTYHLTLKIIEEADTYDYVPLKNTTKTISSKSEFEQFGERITLNGIMKIFEKSPMRDRYVSSDLVSIQSLDESKKSKDEGMKASILVHLTADYLNATPINVLYRLLEAHLDRNGGILGESNFKIQSDYSSGANFSDYDECEKTERNDCHNNATCINTLGSFMCVCKFRYEDISKSMNKLRGRECKVPSTGDDHSDLCSSDDCESRWEYVALVLALFLLLIMSFITYEIIQRKQDFSARKLYEKFGTTKITKLKRASMRRMQENKKKKKEEDKKKKEEKKKKKEDNKKAKEEDKMQKEAAKMEKKLQDKEAKKGKKKKGKKDADNDRLEEESDTEEAAPPTPPLEIMHPPSFPFMEIENVHVEPSDLPGSVNASPVEYVHRTVSPIEESPV